MTKIKMRGNVESLYKISTAFIVSFIFTLFLSDSYFRKFGLYSHNSKFIPFFDSPALLTVYRMLKKKNAMMARLKEIIGIDSSGDEHKD